mgnify:CR=1 FL=1|tara:strand:+ start:22 stop:834 length:813 start_codon:yes stop_codon:yes gene_type:complete
MARKMRKGVRLNRPHLLLQTLDVPLQVEETHSTGMVARLDKSFELESTVRIEFRDPLQTTHSYMINCSVQSLEAKGDGYELRLGYLMAYTTGSVRALIEFLANGLGVGGLEPGDFVEIHRGWGYWFPSSSTVMPREEVISQGSDLFARRRDPRATVRVAVKLTVGGQTSEGQAFNISRSGLFVTSDTVHPSVGEIMGVTYPIVVRHQEYPLVLACKICWVMPPDTQRPYTALGVKITDPSQSKVIKDWRRYVDHELQFASMLRLSVVPSV